MRISHYFLYSSILCFVFTTNVVASSHDSIEVDLSLETNEEVTAQDAIINIQQDIVASFLNYQNEGNTLTGAQTKLLSDLNALAAPETTQAQKNTFYEALSAKKSSTSSNVTRKTPATISVTGISKRLSALRSQSKRSSFRNSRSRKRNGNTLPMIFSLDDRDPGEIFDQSNEAGGLFDQRLSGFMTGNVVFSKQSDTATETGFDGTTTQLTGGADYRINNQTFAGAALGLVRGSLDMKNNGGELTNNAGTILGYGSFNIKPNWYIDGTISSGVRYFKMTRAITFQLGNNPAVNTSASSEPESIYAGFSLGTGFDKTFKNGHNLAFIANFNYNISKIDSFCEGACNNNPQAYSLKVGSQTITSKMINLGGQWSQTISWDWGVLIPQFSVNWVKEFEDKSDSINASFTNDPSGNTMSFKSGNKDLSFVTVKLAASAIFPRGYSGFFQYETQQFVDDYQQYTVSLGARKEF